MGSQIICTPSSHALGFLCIMQVSNRVSRHFKLYFQLQCILRFSFESTFQGCGFFPYWETQLKKAYKRGTPYRYKNTDKFDSHIWIQNLLKFAGKSQNTIFKKYIYIYKWYNTLYASVATVAMSHRKRHSRRHLTTCWISFMVVFVDKRQNFWRVKPFSSRAVIDESMQPRMWHFKRRLTKNPSKNRVRD
jgi:hypothetical protein